MSRRRSILALLLLLVAGAAWLFVATGRLHERARAVLAAAATRQLQREVRIAALRGDPLRGLVLEGLAIARGERLSSGIVLSADQVVVRFRGGALLADLLGRRVPLRSIAEITLVRPDLSLEISAAGRWNVVDLVTGPAGAPPAAPTAFAPLVTVRDGRVELADLSVPPHPFRARFRAVNGRVDFRGRSAIQLDFALLSVEGDRSSPVTVRGRYRLESTTLDVDLTAEGAPLVQWGPYIVRVPELVFEGGTADAAVHVLSTPWGGRRALDYQGTVRLADGAATLLPQRARVRGASGLLRVDNLRIQADDLRVTVEGSPLRLRGEMTLRFGRRLDLAITSPQMDLAAVQRLLFPGWGVRLEGTAGADIRVTGPWSAIAVDGTITQARGTINQQALSVESSGLLLVGDLLVFDNFMGAAEGARIHGDLWVSLGRGDVLLAAEGENVTPEMLRRGGLPLRLPLRGRLAGSVALGRSTDLLVVEATADMGPGLAGPLRVDHLRAGGWYENGEIAFPYLVAWRDRMTVRAAGLVAGGRLAVDAAGDTLDLRTLAAEAGLTPRVRGTVDAEGRISGTLAEPVFDGTIVAGPGGLEPLAFDGAEGPLRLTRHSLSTPGIRLREGEGSYLVSGTVRWTRPSSLALTVDADGIPAASLIRSAGIPLRLTGRVAGRLSIGGTTARPVVIGRVTLTDGGVEGQRVDEAAASFRWQNGALQLDQARARVRDSVLTARGSIDRRGALRLTFAARGFDLRHLTALPSDVVAAAGRVDLDGRIGGTTADPTVVAAFATRDLVLNGAAFDRADGVVRWEDGSLFLEPVTLSQGEGRYTVRGSLGLRRPLAFNLRGDVARGSLATLLAIGRLRPPLALDGRLDGTVSLQGTASRPAAALEARLTGGRFGDHPIDEAELRLAYRDDVVTVDRLTARSGGGIIAAQGRLALQGESQLEVGGADLNVDLLRPLLGISQPLRGTLNFTTQISGKWQDPEIGLSLDVRSGGIGSLRFDSLIANAFYKDGEFHVEQALLSENGHRVKGVGTIPFNPARGVFAEQRPMRFEISLGEADLSLLALLLPSVEEAAGRLEGQILLGGTPQRPEMSGRLAVRGGRIRLRSVATWFEDVAADVGFDQNRISLNTLSARLGNGTLAVSGSIAVANFRPARIERLSVRARNARLEVKPYFAGAVDADLTLSGPLADPEDLPEATGRVVFKQGDLDALPLLSSTGGRSVAPGPDLRLRDVQLLTGDNLVLHMGRLRAELHAGDALLAGGTLRRPTLNGRLTTERGTVTIFGRTFTLREGEARFVPQLGLKPVISFDAETEVVIGDGPRTKIFLQARQVFPEELASERLALRSDPPKSREEIVALLAGQRELTATGADVQAILQAELSRALFGSVEQSIAQALGLSEFTITYDFTQPLQLRIGRLLVRDLYLRLTTIFDPAQTRFVWALEWRFVRNVMLTFSVDDAGRTDALLQYTIRF